MDDCGVGDGWKGYDLLDESSGDSTNATSLASVEAEGELFKVRREMFAAGAAMVGAEQPPFEEICDAVALLERVFDLEVELLGVEPAVSAGSNGFLGVALKAVGDDGGRWRDISADEAGHVWLSETGGVLKARSTLALCSNDDQSFARTPSANTCSAANIGFINFNFIVQRRAILTSGASPQLVHPCPRGLVRPKPEDSLKLLCTDAVLADTHLPDSAKPHPQRLPRLMQDGACRDAGLVTTPTALESAVGELPDTVMVTLPAPGAATPPGLDEISSAGLIVREHRLELGCCLRERLPQVFDVHQEPPCAIYA